MPSYVDPAKRTATAQNAQDDRYRAAGLIFVRAHVPVEESYPIRAAALVNRERVLGPTRKHGHRTLKPTPKDLTGLVKISVWTTREHYEQLRRKFTNVTRG